MLVAPEQLTIEDETRNPEDTDLVGLLYDTVVIRLTIAGEIVLESRTVATRTTGSGRSATSSSWQAASASAIAPRRTTRFIIVSGMAAHLVNTIN